MIILVMGVAGSGKTTIGTRLAEQLGWSFRDADDFHPPVNIAKMSAGLPLADTDRAPWLAAIRRHIEEYAARGESTVVTCSALKEGYRRALLHDAPYVRLVHLTGPFNLIHQRMAARKSHFMTPDMLRSQFDALEPPAGAVIVDISQSPDAIVHEIRKRLLIPEGSSSKLQLPAP